MKLLGNRGFDRIRGKSDWLATQHQRKFNPFRIDEAEALIAALRKDWGEAQANYEEVRFFTGLRPSEQIALTMSDFDAERGTLRVSKARVAGVDRATTKTGVHRTFELCPRAVTVLRRQLAQRERLAPRGAHSPSVHFLRG